MQYEIKNIEFDFEDSYGQLPYDEQMEVYKYVFETMWDVDNEDELADLITDQTGWCVKTLEYTVVSESN